MNDWSSNQMREESYKQRIIQQIIFRSLTSVAVNQIYDLSECEKADSEVEKADSSKEPADKLFYLRRAIRLCPANASFHKQLADEYAQLGRNEDAKASYEDALKLDPNMSEAKKSIATLSTSNSS